MKVGYLGPVGTTYSYLAAKKYYADVDAQLVEFHSFSGIVAAVKEEKLELGFLPAENFHKGQVWEALDAIRDQGVYITEEYPFSIVHCLGVHPTLSRDMASIACVYSKDKALEQCAAYLDAHLPQASRVSVSSSGAGVQRVIEEQTGVAAIAAEESCVGLYILERDLLPNNTTLFVSVQKEKPKIIEGDKSYFAIHPPLNRSGTLLEYLQTFADCEINLDSISSRPAGRNKRSFYLEAEVGYNSNEFQKALRALSQKGLDEDIQLMGCVRNTHWRR